MSDDDYGDLDVDLEIVEETVTSVAEDGSVVTETIALIVDEKTGEAVVDTIVDVVTPDGDEVTEETLSLIDAAGNVEVVGDSDE